MEKATIYKDHFNTIQDEIEKKYYKKFDIGKKKYNNQIQNEDKLSDIFENMKVQFKWK